MTKLTTFSLLLFLSLTVVFTSCKKDEDTAQSENKFVLQGETYPLDKGYLVDFDANANGTHEFLVILASSGISFGTGGTETGIGDVVYIEVITPTSTGLVEGTYNFDSNSEEALTIVEVAITTTEAEASLDASAGTVNVELNGSETILTFSFAVEGGATLTGYYKGVLQAI